MYFSDSDTVQKWDLLETLMDIRRQREVSNFWAIQELNLLKPNDIYTYIYMHICRTAALTSRRYILNIYSTNIYTEYFKHAA